MVMRSFIFRVDSSVQIGSGHLIRCLTLAKKLEETGEVFFISRDLPGNLNYLVKEKGYKLFTLPCEMNDENLSGYEKWLTVSLITDAMETKELLMQNGAGSLIIDHYAIDAEWEKMMRAYVRKIIVIDDLANRSHDCDILIDQNFYCDFETRYVGLVPAKCKLLLGPRYAILREEFQQARESMRIRDGIIRNILVFFGGSDKDNVTMKALLAIRNVNRPDITVDVVVGASNPHQEGIKNFCDENANMRFHCQISYMAKLMHAADLAIGAGGTTTWERCFLGLPAIVIAIAENQVQISEDCASLGILQYAGKYDHVTIDKINDLIKIFLQQPQYALRLQKKGIELCNGTNINSIVKELVR